MCLVGQIPVDGPFRRPWNDARSFTELSFFAACSMAITAALAPSMVVNMGISSSTAKRPHHVSIRLAPEASVGVLITMLTSPLLMTRDRIRPDLVRYPVHRGRIDPGVLDHGCSAFRRVDPEPHSREPHGELRGDLLVLVRDAHIDVACLGSFWPAAVNAFQTAAGYSRSMPMTSPVDFISGPRMLSTPTSFRNGNTEALTAK